MLGIEHEDTRGKLSVNREDSYMGRYGILETVTTRTRYKLRGM